MFAKKTTLACATAVGLALGATSLSAQPLDYTGSQTGPRTETGVGSTPMRYKTHRKHARVQRHVRAHQRHGYLAQPRQSYGLLDAPFAAVEGVGAATGAALAGAGAVIGGTTAAVTGYPYWSANNYGGSYGGNYGYAPSPYGSYAYAPGAYASGPYYGWAADRGHQYYNGAAAPASQDNCAVDGGYGRLDYSIAC
jgi:hypothetical protein